MNWKALSLASLLSCSVVFIATADNKPKNFNQKQTFTGTAVYLAGGQIQFGFNDSHRGWIDYSARPGYLFRGPITDKSGKVIREGDLLMHITDTYRVAMVEQFKAQLRTAEVNLNFAKFQYAMAEKLAPTAAASEYQVQQAEQQYYAAIAGIEGAKAQLIQAQQLLEVCSYRAQYDGIVDTVMVPAGYLAGEEPVMKIYQMNPIGINVPMDGSLITQITYNTPVTIKSSRPNSKPVGVISSGTLYNASGNTGITFQVVNKLLDPPVEAKNIPIFERWGFAYDLGHDALSPMYVSKRVMLISKDSVFEENGRSFAWKVEGAKMIAPDAGISYISTIKKIEIQTGDIQKIIDNNTLMIEVKNSDIEEGNTFLLKEYIPSDIKDGDKVCLYRPIYTFMPGDTVTVEIGPNPNTIK